MAFCKNCGKELPENGVCECGATATPVEEVKEVKEEAVKAAETVATNVSDTVSANTVPSTAGGLDVKMLAIIGGAAVIGLIIIIALFSVLFGGGYKKPVEKYFKSIQKADMDKYISVFPEEVAEGLEDEIDDEYDGDFEDYLDDEYLDTLEDDYGRNIKFKVKFEEKDEVKNRDIKAFEEMIDADISKAYEVEFTLTVKGKEDDDELDFAAYVGKVDGEGWKLLMPPYEKGDIDIMDALGSFDLDDFDY